MSLPNELKAVYVNIVDGSICINGEPIMGDVSEMHLDYVDGEWSVSLHELARYTVGGRALLLGQGSKKH